MFLSILGTKLGMTQIFDQETGIAIPVTVVQAGPCKVTQVKTKDTDGYSAIQVGYLEVKPKALSKPEKGHLSKANAPCLRHLKEYRLQDVSEYQLGQEITVGIFDNKLKELEGKENQPLLVDVTGTSIGRGFAGYQRRHNFKRGPMSHGSKNHRLPGSTGPGTTPGRIFPGKKMAGQMGAKKTTVRKLQVVQANEERNILVLRGSVPGKPGTLLSIAQSKQVGN